MKRTERIEHAFNNFTGQNSSILKEFYHQDIKFVDPIGSILGLDLLTKYYASMYQNVQAIKFDFHDSVEDEEGVMVSWTMIFSIKKLNQGRPIHVEGASHLKFDRTSDKVIYHRDYFDMGRMVYEYIPVLGWMIKKIRQRLEH